MKLFNHKVHWLVKWNHPTIHFVDKLFRSVNKIMAYISAVHNIEQAQMILM